MDTAVHGVIVPHPYCVAVLTRPDGLPDERVAGALAAGWGLAVDGLAHAPVGFGSHHWRATAGADRWFVTVDDVARAGAAGRLAAALATARRLCDAGLGFVVAPVATRTGAVLHRVGAVWAVSLFPHVEGATHPWGAYPGRAERLAVLDLVARLHRSPAALRAGAVADDLALPERDGLDAAVAGRAPAGEPGPFAAPARDLLAARAGAVRGALGRYDDLAAAVLARPDRLVLTHGEPHRGNTISTAAGPVLVDWDTALVAPPERDLWSMTAEDARIPADYEQRTGIAPDPDALAFYRLRWGLTDISLYVAWFRRPHGDTADTRLAWEGLQASVGPRLEG